MGNGALEDGVKIQGVPRVTDMKLNVVDNVGSNYTTITKVVEYNNEDSQDLIGHKTMLRISSWGIEYYVDYDWYADYFGVLTNILYIEKY